jgi:hypothetical protein
MFFQTTAMTLLGCSLTQDDVKKQTAFATSLSKIVQLSFFLPRWLIQLVWAKKMLKLRNAASKTWLNEIQTYRNDLEKNDSFIFR